MEKHSVSKLIGSPPGYVGCEDGGQLTERVRKCPYSIVLFDEIEKAHGDVANILLQILDEGYLTDNNGRKVNFRNTIVIVTSNVGSETYNKSGNIGFSNDGTSNSHKDRVLAEAKRHFKPELLNRLDEIVVFDTLGTEQLENIANKLLLDLTSRADRIGIKLSFEESAIKLLALEKSTKEYGARPLKRKISECIETPLSEQILLGNVKSGDRVNVYAKHGKVDFKISGKVSVN
jgi:ATP-dependent Clp protease ATP-binding subunit ClpC